jgi:hypothetical protein
MSSVQSHLNKIFMKCTREDLLRLKLEEATLLQKKEKEFCGNISDSTSKAYKSL